MKITYRDRNFIGDFKCIDTVRIIHAIKSFWSGNLLYCYVDRYNLKTIAKEDIISMEN